jgi:hypothetical protein
MKADKRLIDKVFDKKEITTQDPEKPLALKTSLYIPLIKPNRNFYLVKNTEYVNSKTLLNCTNNLPANNHTKICMCKEYSKILSVCISIVTLIVI